MGATRFSLTVVGLAVAAMLAVTVIDAPADYKFDYYDYNEMVALLEDLETQSTAKTPDVFSLQVIGDSYLGNPIYAVKISDNPDIEEDAEPYILIDSGIHANEWLGTDATVRYIEYLFDAYYNDCWSAVRQQGHFRLQCAAAAHPEKGRISASMPRPKAS